MARVTVVGMSSFGYYLARKLAELGSEVLAIDKREEMIDAIKPYVEEAIIADVMDQRVIEKLGLKDMDTVVLSLGSNLEASIISAMRLKELGVANIIAKALSEDHAKILEKIGVKRIIFPERDIALRVAASVHGANIADYVPLGVGLSILEMLPLREMVGKTLVELDFRRRYHCQILAVRDKVPEEKTFIPSPDLVIKASHILIVMGENKELAKFQKGTA